jgi:hypothetical protein
MKLDTLIRVDRLRMEYKFIGETTKGDWACRQWRVTLKRDRRKMTFDYFTGMSLGDPEISDVVGSIILDSSASNYSFEEWAEEYSYNPDSRKAKEIYNACNEQADKFSKLINDDEIFDLYMEAEA